MEALNERAVAVIARVQAKLSGRDFPGETLTVPEQVERLVQVQPRRREEPQPVQVHQG